MDITPRVLRRSRIGQWRIEREEARERIDTDSGFDRQKQPQAPGDDFAEEAEGFELLDLGVAEAGQLDALCAHQRRQAQSKTAAQFDARRAGE